MTHRLTTSLREAPATVPALASVVLFVVWATDQAGYPVTHWAPGGLIVMGLLAVAVGAVGVRPAEVALPVRIALGCLAGYTALSYLSILWAAVPGDAWEGANRTLLYLLVFALFAGWRQRGTSAALLLSVWVFALAGLGVFVVLHLDGASAVKLQALVPYGRLIYPSGYANANAALWSMAFWPAVLLARSKELEWWLRGALAGAAVLLAQVALLSQSRGWLYATVIMLVLVFALLPGRVRTFALLVPVAAGVGASAPAVLRVGDNLSEGHPTPAAMHSATVAIFIAAVAVALIVAFGAAVETRRAYSAGTARRVHRLVGAVAIATLVGILAGGWVAAGDPIARARHAWHTFKGGYSANSTTGSRLISGLGSNRYDFYRVALDEFAAHPLIGIGVDNFEQQYLAHGRSEETPHYPHSVELRTLTQTGLLGGLLAVVGLAAALLAGARACRPSLAKASDPLAAAVAAAALTGFAYWVVHGSFDWFWEFAGLGAPAFALLGLACALAPPRAPRPEARARALPAGPRPTPPAGGRAPAGAAGARRVAVAAGICLALVAAASLAATWLSQLQIESAARIWSTSRRTAYARLEDAARLNPLSDEADLLAGSIAVRYGELALAERKFSQALGRSPNDAYATLERGAIASTRGERALALALLERAARLNPRDPLTQQALIAVRAGRPLSVQQLDRAILVKAQQLA